VAAVGTASGVLPGAAAKEKGGGGREREGGGGGGCGGLAAAELADDARARRPCVSGANPGSVNVDASLAPLPALLPRLMMGLLPPPPLRAAVASLTLPLRAAPPMTTALRGAAAAADPQDTSAERAAPITPLVRGAYGLFGALMVVGFGLINLFW